MSQIRPRSARTGFIITPYLPDQEGGLVPDPPSHGPCAEAKSHPCELSFHHERDRKTGPRFPLAVFSCRTHRRAFTLYPPGYVPYGRNRIAPVAENGDLIRPDEPLRKRSDRPEFFRATYFDAALDAGKRIPWHREPPNPNGLWWPTQGRHLERSVSWLGIAPDQNKNLRHAIAGALDVPALSLCRQARAIQTQPGYETRGQAVRSLLSVLPQRPCLLDQLALAGHLAGLWTVPLRWDPRAKVIRGPYGKPLGTTASHTPG